jgi:hypothetical protein
MIDNFDPNELAIQLELLIDSTSMNTRKYAGEVRDLSFGVPTL